MRDAVAEIMSTVRDLCRFEGRWPGTNAEREAANYLANRLQSMDREVEVEPIRVRPDFAVIHSILTSLAIAGSVVSVYLPPLGVAIILLAAASMFGDLTTRFYLFRWLLPSRASQNVTSKGSRPDAPARLILTAHHDAGRCGMAFRLGSGGLSTFFERRLKTGIGPYTFLFGSMMVVLALASLRLADVDTTVLTAIQFAFTVALIVSLPLQLDVALSEVSPGANDNASGVATVLELAKHFEQEPLENLDIWVVFTGAEEGLMLGMRKWMQRHSEELPQESTYFINIDSLGYGYPRYLTKEGFIFLFDFDPELIELCEEIAQEDADGEKRLQVLPYKSRVGSDALIPTLAGYPAITISSLTKACTLPNYHRPSDVPENIDPSALERSVEFLEQIAVRLDQMVAPNSLPLPP